VPSRATTSSLLTLAKSSAEVLMEPPLWISTNSDSLASADRVQSSVRCATSGKELPQPEPSAIAAAHAPSRKMCFRGKRTSA
jgi:hypothetical protein